MRIQAAAVLAVLFAVRETVAFVPGAIRPNGRHAVHVHPRMALSMVDENVGVSDLSIPYDAAARLAYDEWRAKFNKGPFDPQRYEVFKTNYETITVANVVARKKAREAGDTETPALMSLNEFGDCTEEEYAAAQKQQSVTATSTGSVLGKALEAAVSQSEASSALEDAANALAEEEEKLAKQLGLESVEELEVALDSLEGIASDGGELESENLAREARVRSAYLDWCTKFDKTPDESRFPVFSSNFLAMEEYGQKSGKEVTLNEYADRTEEEFEQLQSRKSKVSSAAVVDEVAAVAAAAAAEAERVKARAEARARAEAERKRREEVAAKERAEAAERAKIRAEEEKARQKELEAKLKALKEWQAKSEGERRAQAEKERVARQRAQEQELERVREEKQAEAIRLARAQAERDAAQVAERRARDAEAARILRQQAQEWEEKQKKLALSKAPSRPAPAQQSILSSFFAAPIKQAEKTKSVEVPRFEFELKLPPPPKVEEEKKSVFDLSALNKLIPTPELEKSKPAVTKKPSASKSPSFSFFSPPAQPKAKVAPEKPTVPTPATEVKKTPSTPKAASTFSFFSTPAPKKAVPAPAAAPPVAKPAPKAEPVFSFFSSPPPKAKAAPAPVPVPASPPPRETAKAAPAFSFFSSPAPKAKTAPQKEAPAPVPIPAPAKSAPSFSFFSSSPAPKVAPKAKSAPAPVPIPASVPPKATPAFSFFGSPAATKAKAAPAPVPPPAPVKAAPAFSFFGSPAEKAKASPAPRPSISLFGQPEPKPKVSPKIPNRGGTISLFSGPVAPRPSQSTQPKIPKGTGTISLFSSQAKQAASTKSAPAAAVTNIPVLSNWRQNPNGSITGVVSNSKQFKTGTEITTSPVPKGARKGSVVKTGSGSQYLLK